jgi:hypothetical protein
MLVHHTTFFRALAATGTIHGIGTFASACGDVRRVPREVNVRR